MYWDFNGWAGNPVPGPQDAQRRVAIIVTTHRQDTCYRVGSKNMVDSLHSSPDVMSISCVWLIKVPW